MNAKDDDIYLDQVRQGLVLEPPASSDVWKEWKRRVNDDKTKSS